MWPVITALSGAALLLTGCVQLIDGATAGNPGAADPAAFFDGPVRTYGHRVSPDDTVRLAYLRALRRVDVCGLSDRDSLARIGEIQSMGTLFALDECDVEVKMPGEMVPKYVSATVELTRAEGPEVARVDGVPVRESFAGACEYLIPLAMSALPGAGPLAGSEQPHLRVGMVAESDCAVVRRAATAIASELAGTPLPLRDGTAAYTVPLAERDPCEVLGILAGDEISFWNVRGGGPYRCEFGFADLSMKLTLRPRVVDVSIDGRELIRIGDTEVYLDRQTCAALAFVGPDMRRRLGNGDLVDTGDVRIRPAIDIDSEGSDCTSAAEVAGRAAALYR